jgi:hypothetical protein
MGTPFLATRTTPENWPAAALWASHGVMFFARRSARESAVRRVRARAKGSMAMGRRGGDL